MENLQFKRTLKTFVDKTNVELKLVKALKDIPDIADLRLNVELTLYICCCIECEVNSIQPSKKPDKQELFIKIMDQIFNLTEVEVKLLKGQVEVLHSMAKIKGVPTWKIVGNFIGNWLYKKLIV